MPVVRLSDRELALLTISVPVGMQCPTYRLTTYTRSRSPTAVASYYVSAAALLPVTDNELDLWIDVLVSISSVIDVFYNAYNYFAHTI